jgi:hypothetical protein
MRHVLHLVTLMTALCVTALGSAASLRDPMRPPGAAARTQLRRADAPLRLQAILGNDESRLAIVNGQVARVGQSLNGVRILAIDSHCLTWRRGGKTGVLQLPRTHLRISKE